MDVASNHQRNGTGWIRPFLRQIRHSWAVTCLLALSIGGIVVILTYVQNSSDFQHRSMQLIMKNMGHNLWFVHTSADLLDVVTGSPNLPVFPDRWIHDLAGDRRMASTYWGNVLQQEVNILGERVLVTGIERVDDHQISEEQPHLLEFLTPGHARLGHDLAASWQLSAGDTLSVDGRSYRVETVYPLRGGPDDRRLWIPLNDAQHWLEQPGRSNLILGFLCMRGLPLDVGLDQLVNRLSEQHQNLDLKVVPIMNILEARALARLTTARYLDYLLMIIVTVTALLIAAVGWMEVNERRGELAIMLAMGARYRSLVLFFLAKLALLAVGASLTGFVIGSYLSVHWLSPYLLYETRPILVVWSEFPGVLFGALALVATAALVPLTHLLRIDPTRILAEE